MLESFVGADVAQDQHVGSSDLLMFAPVWHCRIMLKLSLV
jgi:hypothetical protein